MVGLIKYSPSFSLQGWNAWEWLKGNKEAVKILIPLLISLAVTNNLIEAGVAAIIGKAVLDIFDFYLSKVEL